MKIKSSLIACMAIVFAMNAPMLFSQAKTEIEKKIESLDRKITNYDHRFDMLEKQIDDLMWWQRLGLRR